MGLGPTKYRGIGRSSGVVNAAPASPDSGSGGAGRLGSLSLAPAIDEVSDVATGRITLAMVNTAVIVLLLFYWHTRSAQGGS